MELLGALYDTAGCRPNRGCSCRPRPAAETNRQNVTAVNGSGWGRFPVGSPCGVEEAVAFLGDARCDR